MHLEISSKMARAYTVYTGSLKRKAPKIVNGTPINHIVKPSAKNAYFASPPPLKIPTINMMSNTLIKKIKDTIYRTIRE
jgi:hypothetical protein